MSLALLTTSDAASIGQSCDIVDGSRVYRIQFRHRVASQEWALVFARRVYVNEYPLPPRKQNFGAHHQAVSGATSFHYAVKTPSEPTSGRL